MSLRKKLLKIKACQDGVEWLADQTAEDAWATCQRGDWMLWVGSRCGVDFQTITLTKVKCARLVQHLMQDQRSLDALDIAEQFALGNATREQIAAAYDDAAAAAAAAYAADANASAAAAAANAAADAANAAYAAAYAAYAAAYAAYAADANAAYAAREKILAQCADICRKTIALKVILAGLENLRRRAPEKLMRINWSKVND